MATTTELIGKVENLLCLNFLNKCMITFTDYSAFFRKKDDAKQENGDDENTVRQLVASRDVAGLDYEATVKLLRQAREEKTAIKLQVLENVLQKVELSSESLGVKYKDKERKKFVVERSLNFAWLHGMEFDLSLGRYALVHVPSQKIREQAESDAKWTASEGKGEGETEGSSAFSEPGVEVVDLLQVTSDDICFKA